MMYDVPVIMYHTVGVVEPGWRWNFLTVPWQTFEDQVAFLSAKGYTAITLGELCDYRFGRGTLPPRPVLFTFDDGYLDNWVYAVPILRKYGFRGTVFVNPDFVDPAPVCRPNLDDLWSGRSSLAELPIYGFLSWAEMRAMEGTGVMEVQSHAMTHTWYPSGPGIVDFRHPGDEHVWMEWNEAPERKWDYLRPEVASSARWGEPVYEHRKSLAGPRFFPDSRLADHLAGYVAAAGRDFFSRPGWRDELKAEAGRYRENNRLDERTESDAEYRARLRWELGESQRIIGEQLGKKVEFLCWPGGGYTPEAVEIARELYRASTLASRDPGEPGIDGAGHLRIRRFGVPCLEKGRRYRYPGGRYLHLFIRESQGSRFHRLGRQILKLAALANPRF